MDESEISEVVDLVHSLVLQSRPTSSPSNPFAVEEILPEPPSKLTVKSVPASPCNLNRSQTIPVRKKVAIKSAPLKPPDIGNLSLFPSVEESVLQESTHKRVPLKTSSAVVNNGTWDTQNSKLTNGASQSNFEDDGGFPTLSSASSTTKADLDRDKKLKTLEAKLTGPLGLHKDSIPAVDNTRRASINDLTPSRKTPRSAKLYSELNSERCQKLDALAEKYSKSLDLNQCRSILDELEFIFQLFNSNCPVTVPENSTRKENEPSLLNSSAEQAYFVIKIVMNQLDKLFISMPLSIVQLIIENYKHKIPKTVRKHLEDWANSQKDLRRNIPQPISNDPIPIDLAKTVTFKSEKDGRANFLHQTDFHNFCKQRDIFYSIRESWSSTGNNDGNHLQSTGGGVITDRSRARMSFPPVQPQSGSSSSQKFTDPFPLKVQSMFQINQSPTNLFHMASLFVSHYLLEARALEVGGVPKDDNMKEFFQSNPMKLLQLNSRFSATSSETLENESYSNFSFRKQFLLASSSKFVRHVVDRLVVEITKLEARLDELDVADPSQICRIIKDNIHLARLLGYAECLPYTSDEKKQNQNVSINSIEKESVMREHILFRSHQIPPISLQDFLDNAVKFGKLTASCPWIIEYLLQCDSITLLLPPYKSLMTSLISIYKTVLSQNNSNRSTLSKLSKPNKNFLRFYFGLLFSSKNFPDGILAQLRSGGYDADIPSYEGSSIGHRILVDCAEDFGNSLIEFSFEECFNRLKRILNWGKLEVSNTAITGDIRYIRPIPASDKSSNATIISSKVVSKEKKLQMQLEATFFELYSPSVKRSVDFISERIASTFISIAKNKLFPTLRTTLATQKIFGVRAAEKCRAKLKEEMNKYITEKCCSCIKTFLEPSVTVGVLTICQRIAVRKAEETGDEWIQNYINSGMFPEIVIENDLAKPAKASTATTCNTPVIPEDPPFEVLILIHRMLRKLESGEKVDPQLIDKILSCQSFAHAPWSFIPLVDWGISLIVHQPQALNSARMRQMVNVWKPLWNPNASVINSRNLMLLMHSNNPRDSWIKLGTLSELLISEGMLEAADLEQQCFALLREYWPDEVHKRISEFLTIVLDAFQEKSEWNSESAQVLDWVAWLCSGQPDQD